jgi:GntP family gluconate:H+ symporter
MLTLFRQRHLTLNQLGQATEDALMSGGIIILITAGGGAFGAMLGTAGVGEAVEQAVSQGGQAAGFLLLAVGFFVASVMKIAQGSGTVSMITTAGMLAAMNPTPELLGFHPVYLATAIGSGSVVGSWMNDSGFWVVARMSGLTEVEALKSWTLLLVLLGITAFGITLLAAWLLPLV